MGADRPKIRAVFDCMLFLQAAARRQSPAGACLLLVELNAIELCVTQEIMAEIRDVLARPRLRQKFPALTDALVHRFLAAIERHPMTVRELPRVFEFRRDPKDEPYINLAIVAKANFLVSRDNDILGLADASTTDGERLRREAPELRVLDPVAFLLELRQRGAVQSP